MHCCSNAATHIAFAASKSLAGNNTPKFPRYDAQTRGSTAG
jgi:hypothetical protein